MKIEARDQRSDPPSPERFGGRAPDVSLPCEALAKQGGQQTVVCSWLCVLRSLAWAERSGGAWSFFAPRFVHRSFSEGGSKLHSPGRSAPAGSGAQRALPTSGSALIVVLWVVGLLSMFVMAFAFDMHVEARITSSWRKKLKAEYLSRAGIELARMVLFETADSDINNPDISIYLAKGSDEKVRGAAISLVRGGVAEVTRKLGAGTVAVTIRPENARINLNSMIFVNDRELTYNTWQPLFDAAGVPWEQRDVLIDSLLDWVDQDELTHLNGVESEYYETLDPPYQSKNAALDTVDELALIKGFNEKLPESEVTIYQALSGFLTTYATDQKININAVDRNTMMGFLGIDAPLADEVIAQRQGPDLADGTDDDMPFKNLADLLGRVPALPPSVAERISFTAMGRFSILARGKVGDVEHAVACVVSLAGKNLTILHWIEGDALQANLISH